MSGAIAMRDGLRKMPPPPRAAPKMMPKRPGNARRRMPRTRLRAEPVKGRMRRAARGRIADGHGRPRVPTTDARYQAPAYCSGSLKQPAKGAHTMTESTTVHGHALDALGMVAGRTIYCFTSRGEAYRLTPDMPDTYLLRRPADGYSGIFGTVEEAVAYVATLEQ
jgi:hypothetical protein